MQCPSIKLETCLLSFWVRIRERRNPGDVEIPQTAGYEVAGAEAFCKLEVSHLKPLSSLGISATWLSAGRAAWHWACNLEVSWSAVVTFSWYKSERRAVMAFCLTLAWPPAEERGRSGNESSHRTLLRLQQPRGDRCRGEPARWAPESGCCTSRLIFQETACGKQLWRRRDPRRTNCFLKRT